MLERYNDDQQLIVYIKRLHLQQNSNLTYTWPCRSEYKGTKFGVQMSGVIFLQTSVI